MIIKSSYASHHPWTPRITPICQAKDVKKIYPGNKAKSINTDSFLAFFFLPCEDTFIPSHSTKPTQSTMFSFKSIAASAAFVSVVASTAIIERSPTTCIGGRTGVLQEINTGNAFGIDPSSNILVYPAPAGSAPFKVALEVIKSTSLSLSLSFESSLISPLSSLGLPRV